MDAKSISGKPNIERDDGDVRQAVCDNELINLPILTGIFDTHDRECVLPYISKAFRLIKLFDEGGRNISLVSDDQVDNG